MIRRVLCVGLFVVTIGCTTLRPVSTPREFIPSHRPDRIWVTRADNSKIVLDGPRLMGDTLVGWFQGKYQEMLLPDTRWIGAREPAPRRTLVLAAGAVVVGAGVLYLLAGNGLGGGGSQTEDPSNPSSLLRYPLGRR